MVTGKQAILQQFIWNGIHNLLLKCLALSQHRDCCFDFVFVFQTTQFPKTYTEWINLWESNHYWMTSYLLREKSAWKDLLYITCFSLFFLRLALSKLQELSCTIFSRCWIIILWALSSFALSANLRKKMRLPSILSNFTIKILCNAC